MRNKKDKGWKEVKELNFFTLIHRLASRTVPKSLAHVGRTTAGNNNICATIIPSPTASSLLLFLNSRLSRTNPNRS